MSFNFFRPLSWPIFNRNNAPQNITESDKKESDGLLPAKIKRKDYAEFAINNLYRQKATDHIMPGIAQDSRAIDRSIGAYGIQNRSYINAKTFCWYVEQGFIGYQVCAQLAQNGFISKACSKPAKAAVKNGYTIISNDLDDEKIQRLRSYDDKSKFNITKSLVEYERLKRVFGIRFAMLDIDGIDLELPFNLDGVRTNSYNGIVQIDPCWVSPLLVNASDPTRPDFYQPEYWSVNGRKVHKSHFIISITEEVPDILKPTYQYGGIPLPQIIYERVYAAEKTANEAPKLAATKRTRVLKTDVEKVIFDIDAYEQKMAALSDMLDNTGIWTIGEGDEYSNADTALADLDAVIMTQYQLVAALAGIPATELLETTPKGFNATGESERESYHAVLEGIQRDTLTPLLDRHYKVLGRSLGLGSFDFEVLWNPLTSPTDKELAEIREIDMRTDSGYQLAGVLSAEEIRDKLINDIDSGYNGIARYDDLPIDDLVQPDDDESGFDQN